MLMNESTKRADICATEQVSRWHPDKVADQISDSIVSKILQLDSDAHCGVEVMVKDDFVVVGGEVSANLDVRIEDLADKVVRQKMDELGYKCGDVMILLFEQSREIYMAIGDHHGAGDQGMMFGYADRRTESMLPYGLEVANKVIHIIEDRKITRVDDHAILGDAKVLIIEDQSEPIGSPDRIRFVNVSACINPRYNYHDAVTGMEGYISSMTGIDVKKIFVNPGGEWTLGGPEADCGLTGRKIVCDQYGGYTPVGGGAFSGKDFSKVDRTAAYMARLIAKDVVDSFGFDTCLVQLGYMMGEEFPMNVRAIVDGKHWNYIDNWIRINHDLTPDGMRARLRIDEKRLPEISAGCHFRPVEWGGIG